MKNFGELLKGPNQLSKAVGDLTGLRVYPESVSVAAEMFFALARGYRKAADSSF